MKKTITLILLSLTFFCKAQNLVNNWSFEDTVSCPWYYTQISLASGWSSYKETPDYFNACNESLVSVPSNVEGFQFANTGNAYSGVITYSSFTVNYREIMGTQLTQPLAIGQKYFVSFFVSRAYDSTNVLFLSSNKIGLRFSTVAFSSVNNNPAPINNFAHVYTDSIVTDTLNWIKISGSLIADSAYTYVAIGNFFNDSNTSINNLDTNIFNEFAYYYIDDIKISTDSDFVNTGITTYINNSIKVFPNPARDWIVLEGKGIKSVAILNALGSEIGYYPTTAFTLLHQINFGTLSCGVYFLKINMIDDKFHFQKIIIQ